MSKKPFDKLNFDYTYCNVGKECIHRFGCKRWIGNYEDTEDYLQCWFLEPQDCINDNYTLLDRFRNSNKRN